MIATLSPLVAAARRRLVPLLWLALLAVPAVGFTAPSRHDDHARVTLDPADEAAYLRARIAASPHRRALLQAATASGDGSGTFGDATGGAVVGALAPLPWMPAAIGTTKAWPAKAGRRFYGYLPYWTKKTTQLHWQTLTQLAWFSAELGADGVVGNTHGWGGAEAKALIATAHQHGVQVTLCITLFSTSGISAVIATPTKRTALVQQLVALVVNGGGDGINIDFEGLAKADKANMVAFATELANAMHAALPGSDVTLATPAVDWTGAWDYDALAEATDGLFIMAYGLHWSGGPPGPNLPMKADAPWKHKTLGWVLDDYFQWGKAANKHKFIVGLPFYGHSWASDSKNPGAAALAKGKSVTYENAVTQAPTKGGWLWDAASQSSWYRYQEGGTWMQTWVDDLASMQLRVDLVDERDVMLGCWALGYADKDEGVWSMLETWRAPPSGGGEDAGGSDAGGSDAGGTDAGGTDAGGIDAGGIDAGGTDAGGSDAGGSDAGSSDAGGQDAGNADAASADADAVDVDVATDIGKADEDATTPTSEDAARAADGQTGSATDAIDATTNGAIGSNLASPQPASGCATGTAGRSRLPTGWLFGALMATVAVFARRRRVAHGSADADT